MGTTFNIDNPMTISRDVLVTALDDMSQLPSDDDLRSALRYLEQKGYISVVWLQDGSGGFGAITLKAEGVDLVETTTNDPGVNFVRRR
jgi:hypothetical protein